jgi:hypothetical protein
MVAWLIAAFCDGWNPNCTPTDSDINVVSWILIGVAVVVGLAMTYLWWRVHRRR